MVMMMMMATTKRSTQSTTEKTGLLLVSFWQQADIFFLLFYWRCNILTHSSFIVCYWSASLSPANIHIFKSWNPNVNVTITQCLSSFLHSSNVSLAIFMGLTGYHLYHLCSSFALSFHIHYIFITNYHFMF